MIVRVDFRSPSDLAVSSRYILHGYVKDSCKINLKFLFLLFGWRKLCDAYNDPWINDIIRPRLTSSNAFTVITFLEVLFIRLFIYFFFFIQFICAVYFLVRGNFRWKFSLEMNKICKNFSLDNVLKISRSFYYHYQ